MNLQRTATLLLLLNLVGTSWAERKPAMLIIGGVDATGQFWSPVLSSVELHGCHGGPIRVADLPTPTSMMGGVSIQDHEINHVLLCGGKNGQSAINACYTWDPATNEWSDAAPLIKERHSFLMALGPNLNRTDGSKKKHPIIISGDVAFWNTEIYDQDTDQWTEYIKSPLDTMNWQGCFFQEEDGGIYHLEDKIQRLDVNDWSAEEVGSFQPEILECQQSPFMIDTQRCSPVDINGERGIFTWYGHFFNLNTRQWEKKAFPPIDPLVHLPNALTSFQGKPTIFGNPRCDVNLACQSLEVIQYNPEKNRWVQLDDMLFPRQAHTMVEVPGEYCDHFVDRVMDE